MSQFLIAGAVLADGRPCGAGFEVVKIDTGAYAITYPQQVAGQPVVVATGLGSPGSVATDNIFVVDSPPYDGGMVRFTVYSYDIDFAGGNVNPQDAPFNFVLCAASAD